MLYTHVAQTWIQRSSLTPSSPSHLLQIDLKSFTSLHLHCQHHALSHLLLSARCSSLLSLSNPHHTISLLTGLRGVFWKQKSDLLPSCLILFTIFPQLPSNSHPRTSGLQNLAWPALPSLFAHPPSHPLSCSPLVSIQFLRLCHHAFTHMESSAGTSFFLHWVPGQLSLLTFLFQVNCYALRPHS